MSTTIHEIDPLYQSGHARVLFEIKFRAYFALYDGLLPKVFGKAEEDVFFNLFEDTFVVMIDGQIYNQQQWMEAVKTCIEQGMKIDILRFDFLPNSTRAFIYKLRVVSSGKQHSKEEDVTLLAVGRVKCGKFASFTSSNDKAYRTIFPPTTTSPPTSTLNDEEMNCDKENVVANKPTKRSSGVNTFRTPGFRFERALL